MAFLVGRINSLILRRLASFFTSSITGKAPVPVPITSRWHSQGIFSFTDNGVCLEVSRNFLEGFFLRLRTWPRSITTSCSYVVPSMRIEPNENFSKRIRTSGRYYSFWNDSDDQRSDIRRPRYGSIRRILPQPWF